MSQDRRQRSGCPLVTCSVCRPNEKLMHQPDKSQSQDTTAEATAEASGTVLICYCQAGRSGIRCSAALILLNLSHRETESSEKVLCSEISCMDQVRKYSHKKINRAGYKKEDRNPPLRDK